jgi:hypothetical protein
VTATNGEMTGRRCEITGINKRSTVPRGEATGIVGETTGRLAEMTGFASCNVGSRDEVIATNK